VTAGATFDQKLKKQAWGGRDFIVRDPDLRRSSRLTLLTTGPPTITTTAIVDADVASVDLRGK